MAINTQISSEDEAFSVREIYAPSFAHIRPWPAFPRYQTTTSTTTSVTANERDSSTSSSDNITEAESFDFKVCGHENSYCTCTNYTLFCIGKQNCYDWDFPRLKQLSTAQISLQTLYLYGNPLTSIAKAINPLKNLQNLNLDETHIASLNRSNVHSNLEKLFLTKTNLKFIDDCAFCNFPNLKHLRLYQNFNLSFIHENAFGYAYNGTSPPLEFFSIEFCNLSIIPENLLNWHNIAKFGLGNNPFMCNCSMAWLINDILSPTHSLNLHRIAPHPLLGKAKITETGYEYMDFNVDESQNHKQPLPYPSFSLQYPSFYDQDPLVDNGLNCFGPHALEHVKFIQISRSFCQNQTTKSEPKSNEREALVNNNSITQYWAQFTWFNICAAIIILLTGFIAGLAAFPLTRFLFRRKNQGNSFNNLNFPEEKIEMK